MYFLQNKNCSCRNEFQKIVVIVEDMASDELRYKYFIFVNLLNISELISCIYCD